MADCDHGLLFIFCAPHLVSSASCHIFTLLHIRYYHLLFPYHDPLCQPLQTSIVTASNTTLHYTFLGMDDSSPEVRNLLTALMDKAISADEQGLDRAGDREISMALFGKFP
jgi:hypothetical protein